MHLILAILFLALTIFIIKAVPLPAQVDWARQIILAIIVVCFLAWVIKFLFAHQFFGFVY